ncbi:MAG: hypothetical protein WAK11_06565 [Candidatus Cybelea sp.]
MKPLAIFGINVLASFASSVAAAVLFAMPWLLAQDARVALLWLVVPHMFLRFIGLSFLVPGVVSASLPRTWAAPAAYGDLIAGVLAIIAAAALAHNLSWAIASVWVFNVWGAIDLLYGFYKGLRVNLAFDPGLLGAGYYLVTAVVPPLLVSHALIFWLLLRNGV